MTRLEDLKPGALVRGIRHGEPVEVIDAKWHGANAVELTFRTQNGRPDSELLFRDREPALEVLNAGRRWSYQADGALFRLVSEARRIQMAHLFDPHLAVSTSQVTPLPHQITAVYGELLRRQPLRYVLADDPGAGKTIMAGLFIKELIARGDLARCLIVSPGVLVEQWQDELDQKFGLSFDILTNDALEAARTGNWFAEHPLAIARLDKLSRNEDVQAKLAAIDWDLVVVDEAHKMSASFFTSEVKETKRYKLGKLLSRITRHFLLMTATPHNGKDADFQLFMALLDGDRFEGKFRDGHHTVDVTDMMRRMVKEDLYRFDGTKLFPERIATTIGYQLTDLEARLYGDVTEYVKTEFNRAEALESGRKVSVGFALTSLQRRLASSPEAIYQSLRRRKERLTAKLAEARLLARAEGVAAVLAKAPVLSADDLEDLDDLPSDEMEQEEEEILDQATAARTIHELEAELVTLSALVELAGEVRRSGTDRKWDQLSNLLQEKRESFDALGRRMKLVVFTEYKDTLTYLVDRISGLLGRPDAVVTIHGGVGREERKKSEERFKNDPGVEILVATDAAGEGINLQRAHLMVNYDLPWNPNRLEQRFGRIHRIGQTEVCHLWNLLAHETREGEVFQRLFQKLEEEREALGGRVFDVLGQLFQERPLRDLLLEAIRYGDSPEAKAKMRDIVDNALDRGQLRMLLEEQALVKEALDIEAVRRIREDMERAEARKLQPHFIGSWFIEAFKQLGGRISEREKGRYEVQHVPSGVRARDRIVGRRAPVLPRYERITFDKALVTLDGKPPATFVSPGHPLLDAVSDLVLEQYRDLLKQGAILVDERDHGTALRALFFLEHSIRDGKPDAHGERRVISRRFQFVELNESGVAVDAGYAPYLDYRPVSAEERTTAERVVSESAWAAQDLEPTATSYAVSELVQQHVTEVKARRTELVEKTMAAVKDRLTKEIAHWEHRAVTLNEKEEAGKPAGDRLNAAKAWARANELATRLEQRTRELQLELQFAPLPPVLAGAALIIPIGLLRALLPAPSVPTAADDADALPADTKAMELIGMHTVTEIERTLGYEPHDVSAANRGYDIESRIRDTGKLRFLEVKARRAGATTVFVTKNEITTGLNKGEDFFLALVMVDGDRREVRYVRSPFTTPPDFNSTMVVYDIAKLWASGFDPRLPMETVV
ncbi:helicase-related protein [Gemmatimonas sp.]|uniref:helicase-related protein n=1 Tax=Gemmatimonas sp. TaxID=1962908 RepID=UPI003DA52C47